jgi:hypothetical protein
MSERPRRTSKKTQFFGNYDDDDDTESTKNKSVKSRDRDSTKIDKRVSQKTKEGRKKSQQKAKESRYTSLTDINNATLAYEDNAIMRICFYDKDRNGNEYNDKPSSICETGNDDDEYDDDFKRFMKLILLNKLSNKKFKYCDDIRDKNRIIAGYINEVSIMKVRSRTYEIFLDILKYIFEKKDSLLNDNMKLSSLDSKPDIISIDIKNILSEPDIKIEIDMKDNFFSKQAEKEKKTPKTQKKKDDEDDEDVKDDKNNKDEKKSNVGRSNNKNLLTYKYDQNMIYILILLNYYWNGYYNINNNNYIFFRKLIYYIGIVAFSKQVLDIGALYAILDTTFKHNEKDFTHDKIMDRFSNNSDIIGSFMSIFTGESTEESNEESKEERNKKFILSNLKIIYQNINFPKNAILETDDGAAASIAGKIFTVLTESGENQGRKIPHLNIKKIFRILILIFQDKFVVEDNNDIYDIDGNNININNEIKSIKKSMTSIDFLINYITKQKLSEEDEKNIKLFCIDLFYKLISNVRKRKIYDTSGNEKTIEEYLIDIDDANIVIIKEKEEKEKDEEDEDEEDEDEEGEEKEEEEKEKEEEKEEEEKEKEEEKKAMSIDNIDINTPAIIEEIEQIYSDLFLVADFIYISQDKNEIKKKLIMRNLDPLCHDNGDCPYYRLLHAYYFILFNHETDVVNLIKELYPLEFFNDLDPKRGKINPNRELNLKVYNNQTSSSKRFDHIDKLIEILLSNFTPPQKKVFYLLSNTKYRDMQKALIDLKYKYMDIILSRCNCDKYYKVSILKVFRMKKVYEIMKIYNLKKSLDLNSDNIRIAPIPFQSFIQGGLTPMYSNISIDNPITWSTTANPNFRIISNNTSEVCRTAMNNIDAASSAAKNPTYITNIINMPLIDLPSYFFNDSVSDSINSNNKMLGFQFIPSSKNDSQKGGKYNARKKQFGGELIQYTSCYSIELSSIIGKLGLVTFDYDEINDKFNFVKLDNENDFFSYMMNSIDSIDSIYSDDQFVSPPTEPNSDEQKQKEQEIKNLESEIYKQQLKKLEKELKEMEQKEQQRLLDEEQQRLSHKQLEDFNKQLKNDFKRMKQRKEYDQKMRELNKKIEQEKDKLKQNRMLYLRKIREEFESLKKGGNNKNKKLYKKLIKSSSKKYTKKHIKKNNKRKTKKNYKKNLHLSHTKHI